MNETENMRVSPTFKAWLDELKIHQYQPYAELLDKIRILLKNEKKLKEKLNGVKI
jgi:hypothetical protein